MNHENETAGSRALLSKGCFFAPLFLLTGKQICDIVDEETNNASNNIGEEK